MKIKNSGYKRLVLLLLAVGFLLPISRGCKKDEEKKDEIFTRLLENESIHSSLLNRSVDYAVLLPENYNITTDSFPVVYLLHGFGDNYTAWYKYGSIQYYTNLYASETPAIYVMPQGFNTYYVNKYNGSFPYMDFFTDELVPAIDSLFRTKTDRSQRAVMGFSMGGYGAIILPAMNPTVFSVSVSLSMSFRTDEQYMAESQDAFNYQWASNFGGYGTSGTSRLNNYFIQNSPLHFFMGNTNAFENLKFYIDCGDDEESLIFTSNSLHSTMRDFNIQHEYRVSSGGHSWDYWKKCLPGAFSFISQSFKGLEYNDSPLTIDVGSAVPAEQMQSISFSGGDISGSVLLPPSYNSETMEYPVIYLMHDKVSGDLEAQKEKIFALLYNSMLGSKIPASIVVEIPYQSELLDAEKMEGIVSQIDLNFSTRKYRNGRILLGNAGGGGLAATYVTTDTLNFGHCFLFNSQLENESIASEAAIYYYLYSGDDSQSYLGIQSLFTDIRHKEREYEYRIVAGEDSFESFLSGLSNSLPTLKKRLSITN